MLKQEHFLYCNILYLSIASIQIGHTKDVQTLDTIYIKAITENADTPSEQSKKYIVQQSKSATKLDLSIKETPQTVNVVTQQQIQDFNLTNIRDILSSTPGVVTSKQETNRTTYTARGFDIGNFQVDGHSMPLQGTDYQTGDIDSLLYDRVEVIKGANGLISAMGNPSATVNFIRKKPTTKFQTNSLLSYGSWDTRRGEIDVSGSLTKDQKIRARFLAAQEAGRSYLDHYKQEKTVAGLIFESDITDNTLLRFGYNIQKDRPNSNNWGALPMLNSEGKMLSYPQSYNPVPDWVYWDIQKQNAFFEAEHQFNDDWSLKLSYNYHLQTEDAALLYFSGKPNPNGQGVFEFPSLYNENNKNHHVELSTLGFFSAFNQKHELLFGTSWSKNKVHQQSFYIHNKSRPVNNWFEYSPNTEFPNFIYDTTSLNNKADYQQEQKQAYAATRLHLTDTIKLLLGSNYIQATSSGQNYGKVNQYDRSKVLPYAGITWEINPTYTAYTSYSTIFKPTSSLGPNLELLEPTEGKSYELGIKSSWFDDQLIISSALFRNEFNKFPVFLKRIDTQSVYEQQEIKSQGYEFNIAGQLTDHFNISAGYVQQNMKNKNTGQNTRTFVPEQTINIMGIYQIPQLPQWKIGANLYWQSATAQSNQSTLQQSGYALLDLMSNYDINQNISIQANIRNVTNTHYLNTLEYGQSYAGAPRQYNLAIRFKY